MKRSGPPQRRTELRRTPMTRTQKRRRARVRSERRAAGEHGYPWPEVRVIIYARCAGRCEGCGIQMTLHTMEGHHRRTRSIGPDCPCNALALCAACHHGDTVHGSPETGRELGRIISRHDRGEPADRVVELHDRGQVYLTCDGQYLAA